MGIFSIKSGCNLCGWPLLPLVIGTVTDLRHGIAGQRVIIAVKGCVP